MSDLPPLGRHDPLTAFYRFQVKVVLTGYFQSEVWIHRNCPGLLLRISRANKEFCHDQW